MTQPSAPQLGAGLLGAAKDAETTDDRVDPDRETAGVDDAAADVARSGADVDVTPTDPDANFAAETWDDASAYDGDQDSAGRDDLRADAARSGVDPDQV
jgi:hypothetical protein